MPTQGDSDLFSEEKSFDIGKFNRAGKTINSQYADPDARRALTIRAILGGLALMIVVYIIFPTSEEKKVRRRVNDIFNTLKGPVAVLDLTKYIDSVIETDISVLGFSYRESLESGDFMQ